MNDGDPGMTRTCDLRFRKPSLYPAELRDRSPADIGGCFQAEYQSEVFIASLSGLPRDDFNASASPCHERCIVDLFHRHLAALLGEKSGPK
jgi:hypothetical protein